MCKLFKVSTSGYYKWLPRPPSKRTISNLILDEQIKAIYIQHKGLYGYRRIYHSLTLNASMNRVRRRMITLNLYAVTKKKYKATRSSSNHKYAPNLLQQDFTANHANQKWISDITEMKIHGKKLYLAVIIDLYSRKVIGWSMSNRMPASLVCNALNMAMRNRNYPSEVILHSDRGSQYSSTDYQKLMKLYGLICSMSAKGCCYDNAACESFFSTLKIEHVYLSKFRDVDHAKSSIFSYIEAYYNRIRLHSSIGYNSPLEFELNQLNLAA